MVTGTGDAGEAMVLVDGDAVAAWTTPLPTLKDHVDSLAVDENGQYAAAGMRAAP